MRVGTVRGVDLLAVAAALIAAVAGWVYVRVIQGQGDQPLPWVLGVLVGGSVLAAYGAPLAVPGRRVALVVAGCALLVLGLLAILTIGLPILAAAALALLSGAREARPRVGQPRG